MLPDWISPLGTRYRKVTSPTASSPPSERAVEEAHYQKQVDVADTFLACLYSIPLWNDNASVENSNVSSTLSKSFAPVYSVGKEALGAPESEHSKLKVTEMFVMKYTPVEWGKEYKILDLEKKIEAYNSIARGMEITLHEDGIHFGCYIRVNINIEHIRVVEAVEAPTLSDVVNTTKSKADFTPTVDITRLVLPPNTTEVIDVDSETTARQLIVKLFKKLRMVDYPKRFALYEYEQEIDETAGTLTKKLTRISDDACPLKVILNWQIPNCGRAFVIQKNDNTDTQYGVDEVPLRDVFMEATGLQREQVDVGMRVNPRTGLFGTTYSKLDSDLDWKLDSSDDSSEDGGSWKDVFDKKTNLFLFVYIVFGSIILIIVFRASYDDTRPRGTVSRKLLKKYLDEFLENLLNDLEK